MREIIQNVIIVTMNTLLRAVLPTVAMAAVTGGCVVITDDAVPGPPSQVASAAVAAPAFGVQYHIEKFAVPLGTEVNNCFYFKSTNSVDLAITRMQFYFPKGSHHVGLFESDVNYPDHMESCPGAVAVATQINAGGFSLLANVQKNGQEVPMPVGVARRLSARKQMMMQVHYVNASTEATDGNFAEVYVNLTAAKDVSTIREWSGSFGINNLTMLIPPRSAKTYETTCQVTRDTHFFTATGHFHSRGKRFEILKDPTGTGNFESFYTMENWDDPYLAYYDKAPIFVPAGGQLKTICAYQNSTDIPISQGNRVEDQEHCFASLQYYPKLPGETDVTCIKGD